jgi:GntR family transcriptional regulator
VNVPKLRTGLPRTLQIENILRQRLARFGAPGEKFTSEPNLAREFGVSRTLIRSVIAKFEKEGLLRRDGRKGTFIKNVNAEENGLELSELIQRLSAYDPGWHIEVLTIIAAQGFDAVRRQLQLPQGEQLILIERKITDNGAPLSFTRSFISFAYAGSFTKADLQATPISSLIAQRCGIEAHSVDQYLQPELADLPAAEMLETPLGAPVLMVERLYRGEEDQPLFLSRASFRGQKYRLTNRL